MVLIGERGQGIPVVLFCNQFWYCFSALQLLPIWLHGILPEYSLIQEELASLKIGMWGSCWYRERILLGQAAVEIVKVSNIHFLEEMCKNKRTSRFHIQSRLAFELSYCVRSVNPLDILTIGPKVLIPVARTCSSSGFRALSVKSFSWCCRGIPNMQVRWSR